MLHTRRRGGAGDPDLGSDVSPWWPSVGTVLVTPLVVGLVLSMVLAAIGDAFFVGLERTTVRWAQADA